MEIKDERLLIFITLYKQQFGVELTKSQAHEKAQLLLHFALMYLKPLPKISQDDIMTMPNDS